jgi:hypothetical protein
LLSKLKLPPAAKPQKFLKSIMDYVETIFKHLEQRATLVDSTGCDLVQKVEIVGGREYAVVSCRVHGHGVMEPLEAWPVFPNSQKQ